MTLHSYVGTKTTLKGNFECAEDFLVEGTVEGNLRSEGTIVLGRDAVIRGEVSAREVTVSGVVVGGIARPVRPRRRFGVAAGRERARAARLASPPRAPERVRCRCP